MTTSSAIESEANPMRNRGYEADSTSTASPEVVLTSPEVESADGGNGTLRPLLATSSLFSSLSLNFRKRTGSLSELFTCHLCSFVGSNRSSFDQHMVDCHYIYRCSECSYSARTQGRLKRHLRDTHRRSAPITSHPEGSGRPSLPRSTTGDHLVKKKRLKTIRCKYCKFSTVEKSDFWRHLSDHIPPDKQLRCGRCPFVTDLKHHHEYHLRSHDGFKPFLCLKCGYSCVNKSMLNSHNKSHSNVYRFRCAVCSFAAKYSHALKLHVRKYGHSAGPVLNQDGSLPVAVETVTPPEFPIRDRTLADKQASIASEMSVDKRYPMQLTFAPVEKPWCVNFSTPGMSVFHEDGEAVSVPVTLGVPGKVAMYHDDKRSMSTSPVITMKTELNEATNLSLESVNGRRTITPGHSSAVIIDHFAKEKHKDRENLTEGRKQLEEGPTLDLPLGTDSSSLAVTPFQLSSVDLRCASGESALDLSSLLQRRMRVLTPFPSHSPDLSESENINLYPQVVNSPEGMTASSAATNHFQPTIDSYSPTRIPSLDPEGGSDKEQTFIPPGIETDTSEQGESISMDESRWDDEKPLDLTLWKGLKVERGEVMAPTFRNVFQVDETTFPLPPALPSPSHHELFPDTYPSSRITSSNAYHPRQSLSYLPQSASSYHSPPSLLPLSKILHRNETRQRDRIQLIDIEDEVLVPTNLSQDPSSEAGNHQNSPPFFHRESSPVELEKVDGMSADSSLEGREFECRHCRMIFQDYVMYTIHSDHHGYLDPFECNRCGTKCEDRIQFFLHISRVAHL